MEYKSINNMEFKIAAKKQSAEDIVSKVESVEETAVPVKSMNDVANNALCNWMWAGTILLSFIVWIVCIISLILNIVRKNVGKAVFSGVGLVLPILAIFIATLGRVISSTIVIGIAILIQIITIILSFIFCFSKNKKAVTQQNYAQ